MAQQSSRSVLAAVLGAVLPAQTFVVDAAMGPGAHFPDIASAVAAVPDGAHVEVRAGTYGNFTIDAKSLVISGLPGAQVIEPILDVRVRNLGPGQAVTLRQLAFGGTFVAGAVRCDGAAGRIVLQGCRFLFPPLPGAQIVATSCADVHLVDVRFLGSTYPPVQLFQSRALLSGCVLPAASSFSAGGVTLTSSVCEITNSSVAALGFGVGSSALVLGAGSEVRVRGNTTLQNMSGPSMFPQPLVWGHPSASLWLDPSVQLINPGGPLFVPGLTVTVAAMPSVTASPAPLGVTAIATLTLPPGAVGGLWLGLPVPPLIVPPFATPLHLTPLAAVPMTSGATAVQTAAVALPNAPVLRGIAIGWQGVSLGPASGLQASNAVVFTLW